jgi:putative Holliday junction resolvase
VTILGIDPGEKRIGVAVSDPLGVTARPVSTLEHVSLADDVAGVVGLAGALGAVRVVVGHPLNMDGSVGRAARRARRFANAIRRQSGLDVVLWDERLTTVEAEEALSRRRTGAQPPRGKGIIDRTAAAIMLQDYLNAQGSAGASCA